VDHFENIAKTLLEREGYWIIQSFKVGLTPAQKADIHHTKASIPRPEIDLLALNVAKGTVTAFEVKSFFDSPGVKMIDLAATHDIPKGRYKLFTCERYRQIVLGQLREDLLMQNLITPAFKVRLGLIAGNGRKKDIDALRNHFTARAWEFWGPEDVKCKVQNFASEKYCNDPAVITAKILQR
jgi:hypothetical protein